MQVINNILDLLFPRRTDERRIAELSAEQFLASYAPHAHAGCTALASYSDPDVRACIQELKYHNNAHGAHLLGTLLSQWTARHITEPTVVIPVPLSAPRFRERGYNQVTRIAQEAYTSLPSATLDERALIRTRNTQPQTALTRTDRTQNVQHAFHVPNAQAAKRINNAHILLIDDVLTTGATLNAARAALVPHNPASITCVALAH